MSQRLDSQSIFDYPVDRNREQQTPTFRGILHEISPAVLYDSARFSCRAHAFASSVYFYRLNVQPTDGSASIAYVKKMMVLK